MRNERTCPISSTYNGNGTVPAATNPYNPIAITSIGNVGGSYNVTTTTPHGFNDGDTVTIEGTATTASGLWQIIKTGSSTFILDGSTYVGSSGAVGIAIDYSVNPLITLPSDGDPRDASSINPALEESANIVPYLYQRVGQFNLYNISNSGGSDALTGNYVVTTVASGDGWKLISTSIDYNTFHFNADTDWLEIDWNLSVDIPDTGGVSAIGIGIAVDGASIVDGDQVTKSFHRCGNGGTPGADIEGPLNLHVLVSGADLSLSGDHTLSIGVMGHVSSTSIVFTLLNPWSLFIKHYRSNL